MADRWLSPLQAITANDYQTSHHTLSTGEMKTIRWWETVVRPTGIRPSQPLILARPFLWIISPTASVFVVLFECHRICLFSKGGLKYSESIYKQQTETGMFMSINYPLPFHSPFAHYEISCSFRQFPNTKPGTEQNVHIFKHLLWNLSKHPMQNLYSGLSCKSYFTSPVIYSSGLSYQRAYAVK